MLSGFRKLASKIPSTSQHKLHGGSVTPTIIAYTEGQTRSFIDISKVIPTDKPYGYILPDDLSEKGKECFDHMYNIEAEIKAAKTRGDLRSFFYKNPRKKLIIIGLGSVDKDLSYLFTLRSGSEILNFT